MMRISVSSAQSGRLYSNRYGLLLAMTVANQFAIFLLMVTADVPLRSGYGASPMRRREAQPRGVRFPFLPFRFGFAEVIRRVTACANRRSSAGESPPCDDRASATLTTPEPSMSAPNQQHPRTYGKHDISYLAVCERVEGVLVSRGAQDCA